VSGEYHSRPDLGSTSILDQQIREESSLDGDFWFLQFLD
jgi:hypothetical protein